MKYSELSIELKQQIVDYYLEPHSEADTRRKFNINNKRWIGRILSEFNIAKHDKALNYKLAKSIKIKCPICSQNVTPNNLNKHLVSHGNKQKRIVKQKVIHDGLNCIYCEKECKNKNSLAQHECRCSKNPNKIFIDATKLSHPAWNKGLTAKTDIRISKQSSTWKEHYLNGEITPSQLGKAVSEETRAKISSSMKAYLAENPEKTPFKLNHSSKQSYPECYFEEWLSNNGLLKEKEFQVSRYTLDFAWPEVKVYLEIDGSQHSLGWMVEHDTIRTAFLSSLGWTCVRRVYWPDYKKLSKIEQINYLEELFQDLHKLCGSIV